MELLKDLERRARNLTLLKSLQRGNCPACGEDKTIYEFNAGWECRYCQETFTAIYK